MTRLGITYDTKGKADRRPAFPYKGVQRGSSGELTGLDYELPDSCIARYPPASPRRGRMLVVHPDGCARLDHFGLAQLIG